MTREHSEARLQHGLNRLGDETAEEIEAWLQHMLDRLANVMRHLTRLQHMRDRLAGVTAEEREPDFMTDLLTRH